MSKDYRKYVKKATSSTWHAGQKFDESGAFETVRFGPTDDGFIIGTFRVENNGEAIICKGTVPGFVLGAPYKITGKVIEDKNWGIQVNVQHAAMAKPSSGNQLIAFLGSGAIPCIGPSTAKKIVNYFGEETLDILENNPERLVEVAGIGPKLLKKILAVLPNQMKNREVIGFFADFGISVRTINRLIEEYGSAAKEIVSKNPYLLCRVRGFAFTRADSIAMKLGVPKTHPDRIRAGLIATLRWMCERGGHTVIPTEELLEMAKDKLNINDKSLLQRYLTQLTNEERLICDSDGCHLCHLYKAEQEIKYYLKRAEEPDTIITPNKVVTTMTQITRDTGLSLTDEQSAAVKNLFSRKISIMSGGGGTGKAQPLYAKVMAADGWTTMGEIRPGMKVRNRKGGLSLVTDIFPQGEKEIVEIILEDGRKAECCEEHLWSIIDGNTLRTVTAADMIKEMAQGKEHFIPQNQPLLFNEKDLPSNPRAYGQLLGDTASDGCTAPGMPILASFLFASVEQRTELLEGIISSSGTNEMDGYWRVWAGTTVLANDIIKLARSLGKAAKSIYDGTVVDIWDTESMKVTSIRRTGRKTKMQCLMLDEFDENEEHLYITDDYIVTHNTATCKMAVEVAKRNGHTVCLMAPTGRAARHLADVCDAPGYTMHRALAIMVREATDADFFTDDTATSLSSNAITDAVECFKKSTIIIADEASMMDTEMAAILFKACKDKHLMLVGDPNQLPSVGCGQVLGDLMASSYSTERGMLTKLTKVFRQAEGSPVLAAAGLVQEGKSPVNVKGIRYYETTSNEDVPKIIEKNVLPYLKARQLGYENYAFLSPIKKTPYAGVEYLNSFLRPKLNPHYKKPANENQEFLLQKGDFVMQTKNNYSIDVYNGDIGIVTDVSKDGDVEVLFSGDDDAVEYEKDEVYAEHQIVPAFAMTVHKSQGDQYNTVIIVLTSSQFAMLSRNLLYTAITRAEENLILIGDRKAYQIAAGNQKENKRMTGLKDL